MLAKNRAATACPRFSRIWKQSLALTLLSIPLLAQNAELSGLITDPAGLAVPRARVVVQSADTGATRTVASNQQGEYSVPALLPGPYNMTVEANGFKTIHQNGVVVEVDQRARLGFTLTIGSNTESITVQGSAPLLNASDASVSTLIGNRFVALRANIDETVLPVVITEQGENRNQCEEQRYFLGFSHGFACR